MQQEHEYEEGVEPAPQQRRPQQRVAPPPVTYVVQASPLTKVFLPGWEAKCLANPDLIGAPADFEVTIPRASGAIKLKHNVPVHVSQLLPRTRERLWEVDETKDLIPWLCGAGDRPSDETDIWGVVAIQIGDQVQTSIMSMLSDPRLHSQVPEVRRAAMEELLEKQSVVARNMSRAIEDARERANERVKRAMKVTHHNLIRQWENNVAEGKGKYPPSAAEALGAYVLAEEIKRANAAKQKMVENMTELMRQTAVG